MDDGLKGLQNAQWCSFNKNTSGLLCADSTCKIRPKTHVSIYSVYIICICKYLYAYNYNILYIMYLYTKYITITNVKYIYILYYIIYIYIYIYTHVFLYLISKHSAKYGCLTTMHTISAYATFIHLSLNSFRLQCFLGTFLQLPETPRSPVFSRRLTVGPSTSITSSVSMEMASSWQVLSR